MFICNFFAYFKSQSYGIGSLYCFILCEKPGVIFHARQSVLGLHVKLHQVWKIRLLGCLLHVQQAVDKCGKAKRETV